MCGLTKNQACKMLFSILVHKTKHTKHIPLKFGLINKHTHTRAHTHTHTYTHTHTHTHTQSQTRNILKIRNRSLYLSLLSLLQIIITNVFLLLFTAIYYNVAIVTANYVLLFFIFYFRCDHLFTFNFFSVTFRNLCKYCLFCLFSCESLFA